MSSPQCTICNSPNSRACSSCRSAAYCSVECQQTDWPVHKALCKAFKTFQSSAKPTSNSKLGLLFPVDSKQPRLVWIECELREDDSDSEDGASPYEYPHVQSLLGPDKPFPEHKPIRRDVFRGFDLDHTVEVLARDAFLIDGSKPNICVVELTRGAMHHDWCGPLVVISWYGIATDPLRVRDITLSDFRTAVDYFLSYGEDTIGNLWSPTSTMPSNRPRGAKVQGVRINCFGDQNDFGGKKYIGIAVPGDHPVFSSTPTGISTHMGLPLLIRKYPLNQAWKDKLQDMSVYPYDNQAATFMNLNADMNSEQWAWAPPQWRNDVGSVIVVRQDGKDLTPQQAEALAHYCQFKLQPVFEDSIAAGYVERTREDVVSQFLTRPKFEKFLVAFRKEQADADQDASWLTAKSPYDV